MMKNCGCRSFGSRSRIFCTYVRKNLLGTWLHGLYPGFVFVKPQVFSRQSPPSRCAFLEFLAKYPLINQQLENCKLLLLALTVNDVCCHSLHHLAGTPRHCVAKVSKVSGSIASIRFVHHAWTRSISLARPRPPTLLPLPLASQPFKRLTSTPWCSSVTANQPGIWKTSSRVGTTVLSHPKATRRLLKRDS